MLNYRIAVSDGFAVLRREKLCLKNYWKHAISRPGSAKPFRPKDFSFRQREPGEKTHTVNGPIASMPQMPGKDASAHYFFFG
jgi:hypothetical protein